MWQRPASAVGPVHGQVQFEHLYCNACLCMHCQGPVLLISCCVPAAHLQMSQGKLANGTVAYYSFRTDFDVRSCGNVRPNDASVTVTTQGWYANNNAVYTDLATRPTTQLARKFLNSATATCSGGKLSGLTATFNGVLVTYEKYNGRYGRTIGYGLPASCTPFFAGARDFPVDMKACEDWILSQPVAGFPTTTCPSKFSDMSV